MTVANPVVIVTSHRVAASQKETFEISANSLLSMAARSRGYLGGNLVRPQPDNPVWQIVCRFDSADAAHAWQDEASRSVWAGVLERCAQHLGGQRSTRPDKQTRIDTERPSAAAPRTGQAKKPARPAPPPRWKMAVVTLIAVFPAVLGTNVFVISQLTSLSLIPRTFVLCVIVTILMTWVLMPRLMKLLGPWLNSGQNGSQNSGRTGQVPAEPARTSSPDEPREVLSDDTVPIPIPIPPPAPAPPVTAPPTPGRSRHRAPSQRARRQPAGAPSRSATSPGRQAPIRRR
jgi:antibiotic biosynthesis monooxygenase (ABM) superfamily enzyme